MGVTPRPVISRLVIVWCIVPQTVVCGTVSGIWAGMRFEFNYLVRDDLDKSCRLRLMIQIYRFEKLRFSQGFQHKISTALELNFTREWDLRVFQLNGKVQCHLTPLDAQLVNVSNSQAKPVTRTQSHCFVPKRNSSFKKLKC